MDGTLLKCSEDQLYRFEPKEKSKSSEDQLYRFESMDQSECSEDQLYRFEPMDLVKMFRRPVV